jgi:hypothetical protein
MPPREPQRASRSGSPCESQSQFSLPSNFFAKYRDEIEDMRQIRQRQKLSTENVPLNGNYIVPVAAVKPYSDNYPASTSPQDRNLSAAAIAQLDTYPASPNTTNILAVDFWPHQTYHTTVHSDHETGTGQTDWHTGKMTGAAIPSSDSTSVQHLRHGDPSGSPFRQDQHRSANYTPDSHQQNYSQGSSGLPRGNTSSTTFSSDHNQRDVHTAARNLPPTAVPNSSLPTRNPPLEYTGYSVAPAPSDWNLPGNRNSRVIEVADVFSDATGKPRALASHVTLEEVLDSLLDLPSRGTVSGSQNALDASAEHLSLPPVPSAGGMPTGQAIFSRNMDAMLQAAKQPHLANNLLQGEQLLVRCQYCGRVRDLPHAREHYVTCRHCYSYYCGRECRAADWFYHKDTCNYARINTLCKETILKVRQDPEAQWQMSRVARQGNANRGRGSVNFRFRYPRFAEDYVRGGWTQLTKIDSNGFLYYHTIADLCRSSKNPNLIALCRRYNPTAKFVLSVSIITDIDDQCPSTPPGRPTIAPRPGPSLLGRVRSQKVSSNIGTTGYQPALAPIHGSSHTVDTIGRESMQSSQMSIASSGQPLVPSERLKQRATSLPPSQIIRNRDRSDFLQGFPALESVDSGSLLRSVLKSMENIAPGPVNLPSPQQQATPQNSLRSYGGGARDVVIANSIGLQRTSFGRHTISDSRGHRGDSNGRLPGLQYQHIYNPHPTAAVSPALSLGESEV